MNHIDEYPDEMSVRALNAANSLTGYQGVPPKAQVAAALRSGLLRYGRPRNCGRKTIHELKAWAGVEMVNDAGNPRHVAHCIEYLQRHGYVVSNDGTERQEMRRQ